MAERKVKFKLGNAEVDAWDVPFESTERWTEIKLDDGAVLRLKVVVSNVYRLEGRTDQQGYPVYAVKSTNAMLTDKGPTVKPNGKKAQ
jgi:hypothetical protein